MTYFHVILMLGLSVIKAVWSVLETWADLAEELSVLKKGKNVMLWCGGLRNSSGGGVCPASTHNRHTSCKRSREPGGSESNDEVPDSGLRQPKSKKKKNSQKNRDKKIQTFMKELTMKHGSTYTAMQYRKWCEMMLGNLHSSLDDPPTSSMFVRAEKGEKPDKNKRWQFIYDRGPDTGCCCNVHRAISTCTKSIRSKSCKGHWVPLKVLQTACRLSNLEAFPQ